MTKSNPYKGGGQTKFAVAMQDLMTVFDALTICKLPFLVGWACLPGSWLNCITGWDGCGIPC
jgi:aldehyde:ferredoxin oxidoreductase